MNQQFEQTNQALEMESTDPEFDDSLGNVADAAIDQKALVKNVTDDLASLQRALIEGLFKRLEEQTAHLRAEAATKAEEAAELRQRHAEQAPRVAARSRVVNYKIDEAISLSMDAEVPALRAEIVELTKNLADLLVKASGCDQRVKELEAQQKEHARQLFQKSFPEIRTPLVEVQQSLCDLLDNIWSGMERYELATGLQASHDPFRPGLLNPMLRLDLTPRDRGEEGVLFQRLQSWFDYRRR